MLLILHGHIYMKPDICLGMQISRLVVVDYISTFSPVGAYIKDLFKNFDRFKAGGLSSNSRLAITWPVIRSFYPTRSCRCDVDGLRHS